MLALIIQIVLHAMSELLNTLYSQVTSPTALKSKQPLNGGLLAAVVLLQVTTRRRILPESVLFVSACH